MEKVFSYFQKNTILERKEKAVDNRKSSTAGASLDAKIAHIPEVFNGLCKTVEFSCQKIDFVF